MTDDSHALLTPEPAGRLGGIADLHCLVRMRRQVVKNELGLILTG